MYLAWKQRKMREYALHFPSKRHSFPTIRLNRKIWYGGMIHRLGCKHPRDGLTSLPTFCGAVFKAFHTTPINEKRECRKVFPFFVACREVNRVYLQCAPMGVAACLFESPKQDDIQLLYDALLFTATYVKMMIDNLSILNTVEGR